MAYLVQPERRRRRRISATSATATSATLNSTYAQYGRLTIGYVGVAPTSLGRVKSIFK
jgi:hypothetical protein